jgi:hypothetical protein
MPYAHFAQLGQRDILIRVMDRQPVVQIKFRGWLAAAALGLLIVQQAISASRAWLALIVMLGLTLGQGDCPQIALYFCDRLAFHHQDTRTQRLKGEGHVEGWCLCAFVVKQDDPRGSGPRHCAVGQIGNLSYLPPPRSQNEMRCNGRAVCPPAELVLE